MAVHGGGGDAVRTASGPLEALAQRCVFMRRAPSDDAFGRALLDAGVAAGTVAALLRNEPVCRVGDGGALLPPAPAFEAFRAVRSSDVVALLAAGAVVVAPLAALPQPAVPPRPLAPPPSVVPAGAAASLLPRPACYADPTIDAGLRTPPGRFPTRGAAAAAAAQGTDASDASCVATAASNLDGLADAGVFNCPVRETCSPFADGASSSIGVRSVGGLSTASSVSRPTLSSFRDLNPQQCNHQHQQHRHEQQQEQHPLTGAMIQPDAHALWPHGSAAQEQRSTGNSSPVGVGSMTGESPPMDFTMVPPPLLTPVFEKEGGGGTPPSGAIHWTM